MLLLTYAYAKALPIRDVSLDDISIEYTTNIHLLGKRISIGVLCDRILHCAHHRLNQKQLTVQMEIQSSNPFRFCLHHSPLFTY